MGGRVCGASVAMDAETGLPTISIVDDDESSLEALKSLVQSLGFTVEPSHPHWIFWRLPMSTLPIA